MKRQIRYSDYGRFTGKNFENYSRTPLKNFFIAIELRDIAVGLICKLHKDAQVQLDIQASPPLEVTSIFMLPRITSTLTLTVTLVNLWRRANIFWLIFLWRRLIYVVSTPTRSAYARREPF